MSAAAINESALSDTLFALADPTRRRLLQMLGEGPRPVGELLGEFALSAPAISKHLRVLRQCLLVEEERDASDARLRIYRLRPEPLADLDAWLSHMRAFWELQLDAFAAYVDGSAGTTTPATRKRKPRPKTGVRTKALSGTCPNPKDTARASGTQPQGSRRPRRAGR